MKTISAIKYNLGDTIILSGRVLRHTLRSVDTIITVVAMPIMIMLMFVYVFGGSINTGSISYINYVVPGIILMCVASGVAYTAFRLNNDINKGIFDRFHSMPISKSSILGGHVLTSIVFNSFSSIIILLFALLMGFRTDASILNWLFIIGIILMFMLALTWIAILFGLLAKNAEGAGVFSYILLFLLFISSAFSPTDTMPKAVRLFAENQPMTPVIETIRSLFMNMPVKNHAILAIIWCVSILIVSYFASMLIYNRRIK